jgi:DNA topoisomerase-1
VTLVIAVVNTAIRRSPPICTEDLMATKQHDQDLFDVLRTSGLRKKVARGLTKASGKNSSKRATVLSASADSLRAAAAAIDKRAVDPKRSQAAKKAARTRKRNAAQRSAAAKRGAHTRAKSK